MCSDNNRQQKKGISKDTLKTKPFLIINLNQLLNKLLHKVLLRNKALIQLLHQY